MAESRRHNWRHERQIHASASPDNCDRTERTCVNPGCGLIRITVHPPQGYPYRKWRHPNGSEFTLGATPPCAAMAEIEEVPFR